ncbi:hypothetical protein Nepgr_002699 [Nepenthes gracilis]|uniref:Uncharacterized protein n=1 Tax=Nepenthes gracilis TaxID=150966 RepID=A0AAD3RYK1_NEPGR|nr:hypothetical protein Nepgr_002699 [Nepenthes gracilis]
MEQCLMASPWLLAGHEAPFHSGKPPWKRAVPKWRPKPLSCADAVHNVVESPGFCLAEKSFAGDLGVAPAPVSPSVADGPYHQIANAVDQIEGSLGEALSAELNDCEAGWDNATVFGEYGCLGHALRFPYLTSARFGLLSPINDVNNAIGFCARFESGRKNALLTWQFAFVPGSFARYDFFPLWFGDRLGLLTWPKRPWMLVDFYPFAPLTCSRWKWVG